MAYPYWWFLFMKSIMIKEICASDPRQYSLPWIEKEHNPEAYMDFPPRVVNGTTMPEYYETPDWRFREPPWRAYWGPTQYVESGRPYRISPHYKQTFKWKKYQYGAKTDYPERFGCYCTTVYKRLTVLAGCAVLTPRHVLTTATSTEVIIRDRHNDKTLINLLGLWYDINLDVWNSSMYATPCRIHYHPRYIRPNQVNVTHPMPNVYDLAVWATTYPLHGSTCFCSRANSGWFYQGSTVPRWSDAIFIIGFQYVKSLRRKPMPWFKYAVRTRSWVLPCPKTEWGWFHCMAGEAWSMYGVESGAAWHRATRDISWLQDGLAGLCSFSLKLRSEQLVHYFTVINTHPVLDFLYDAYMGRLPYEYLDQRFHNNQWRAPRPKTWFYVPWKYEYGVELYYDALPYYK